MAPGQLAAKPVDQEPVSQSAVAHRQRAAQFVHDGRHDAGAGQDHLGPVGLKSDDLPMRVRGSGPVKLDLPLHLRRDRESPPEPGRDRTSSSQASRP